jgi:catechol 2,3-dioxygenase-like lactoylglutathione lyase family enzyme
MKSFEDPILFLATANAERSRAFFEGTLGLALATDDPSALVFHVGHSLLRIQKVDRVYAAPYTALGWLVSDIRATIHTLREEGVVFSRFAGTEHDADGIWQAPGGARVAWFQDPDGNVLSLTQLP